MRSTMYKAGRVVIPAAIRERLGLVPVPVNIVVDGTAARVQAEVKDSLIERDGRHIIPATGKTLTAEDIRELRLADQR